MLQSTIGLSDPRAGGVSVVESWKEALGFVTVLCRCVRWLLSRVGKAMLSNGLTKTDTWTNPFRIIRESTRGMTVV